MKEYVTCKSCQPDQDDRGTVAEYEHQCWYAAAPDIAVRVVTLYATGEAPTAATITVSYNTDAVTVLLYCVAHLDLQHWARVFDADDIPRLLRRASGYERKPLCGPTLDAVETPLTRSECMVVQVTREALQSVHAQTARREIEFALSQAICEARRDAYFHQRDIRIDYVFTNLNYRGGYVHSRRYPECDACPLDRDDVDEVLA